MKKAIIYGLNVVLIVWGLLMCVMNVTGEWSIPWWLATLPIYFLPTFFLILLLLSFISTTILGAIADGDKLEQHKDKTVSDELEN